MTSRRFATTLLALVLLTLPVTAAIAGPKVGLGTNVSKRQRVSMDRVDHRPWHALVQRYVDVNGDVAYRKWKQSATDIQALDNYLAALSAASLETQASKSARLAFWINAYNAVTVRGILREYPTTSIRNHTAKLFGYNIWNDLLLTVGGKPFSLSQIEHEVLRKLGEPRIHFAIVCASRSCPRLLNEAYTLAKVDSQLARNAKTFFAQRGNFQFDPNRRQMRLSSILKWFAADFGNSQAEQLRAIAPYLPSQSARDAAVKNSVSIAYLPYDWGLNDQATARTAKTPTRAVGR